MKLFGPGKHEVQGEFRVLNNKEHFYLDISIYCLLLG